MKPNVGDQEAKIRVGLGLAAGVLALTTKSRLLSSILAMGAASGITSGLSRYCPISEYLGRDTAPALTETPIKKIAHKATQHVPTLQ